MNKKKVIIAAVVIALVLSIGGVIAYFTDDDSVTNTFTIGNVEIDLDEPTWEALTDTDGDGIPDQAENMAPGQSVDKDPTVTNTGANDAYVFAKVVGACTTDASPATPKEIFTYEVNSGWYLMTDGSCTNGTITRIYAYGTSSTMTRLPNTQNNNKAVLFDEVTVNDTITGDEAGLTGDLNVVVTAYAIQADGLKDSNDQPVTSPSAVWTLANFS